MKYILLSIGSIPRTGGKENQVELVKNSLEFGKTMMAPVEACNLVKLLTIVPPSLILALPSLRAETFLRCVSKLFLSFF